MIGFRFRVAERETRREMGNLSLNEGVPAQGLGQIVGSPTWSVRVSTAFGPCQIGEYCAYPSPALPQCVSRQADRKRQKWCVATISRRQMCPGTWPVPQVRGRLRGAARPHRHHLAHRLGHSRRELRYRQAGECVQSAGPDLTQPCGAEQVWAGHRLIRRHLWAQVRWEQHRASRARPSWRSRLC